MTEEEKIVEVLHRFINAGLLMKSTDMLLECIADHILGIGLGEQGIVKSKDDICAVLAAGNKDEEAPNSHTVRYEKVNVLLHSDTFASLCGEVIVRPKRQESDRVLESRFFQSLTMTKEAGEWKICALHASTPVITEEAIEAYPLKFAEKTLESLKNSIGEKVYQAEEQYRQAILADTIGFYVIDFTEDCFEKCQCNEEFCAKVEPGTPYEKYTTEESARYILAEDRERFLQTFRRSNIEATLQCGAKELACEYRLKGPGGGYVWAATTVRLIRDAETGHQKGILYVRDIDRSKREGLALLAKASYDGMTKLLNKESFIQAVGRAVEGRGGALAMLDVDCFKQVNDTFGHPVGDQVLIAVAALLNRVFSGDMPVGRLGGDEFCAFLPGVCLSPALNMQLSGLCHQVRQLRFQDAAALAVTCSIGAAACGPGGTFDSLYRQADRALYRSKTNGRGRVSFYEDGSAN